jgi:hypothetical protein
VADVERERVTALWREAAAASEPVAEDSYLDRASGKWVYVRWSDEQFVPEPCGECGRLREHPDAASFSARDLALILIAVGGDMTSEADQFVPQETWDTLFNEGLAETRRPLHGDAYSTLTAAGREALVVAARAALEVEGEQEKA